MFKLTQAYKMQIDQPIVCHLLINKSHLTFPSTFLIDLSSYCSVGHWCASIFLLPSWCLSRTINGTEHKNHNDSIFFLLSYLQNINQKISKTKFRVKLCINTC